MSYIDHLLLLDRIHHHIEHKSTGSPEKFASLLEISESKLYRILGELRDHGAEIEYNAERLTYQYGNDVKINIYIKIGKIDKNQIKGGNNSVYLDPLSYLAVQKSKFAFDFN